jgi:hypothetical protein
MGKEEVVHLDLAIGRLVTNMIEETKNQVRVAEKVTMV